MPVDNPLHTDYVPSIFSHKPVPLRALKQKQDRLERAMKRRQWKVDKQAANNNKYRQLKAGKLAAKSKESAAEPLVMSSTCTSSTETQCEDERNTDELETQASIHTQTEDNATESSIQTPPKIHFADKATQTDLPPFGINDIKGDNNKTKFYTGLPS